MAVAKSSSRADAPDRRSVHALDLRTFTPSAITLLAHKIVAGASALYRPKFGVGVTDWRVIALLGAEPWVAPVRIAEATGLDKAAVSRSLSDLLAAGFVEAEPDAPTKRLRRVALTRSGLALHDALADLALERERRLLSGFNSAERATLQDFVARLLRAADEM